MSSQSHFQEHVAKWYLYLVDLKVELEFNYL